MSRKKASQMGLFEETDHAVSILDRLLTQSRLYRTSADYQKLLDFVVRLRNFAPFNAMLLEIQKPGLSYAASAYDWKVRFGRTIREGSRPLLILWPFGPVALVYDVMDTEGVELPHDVACFPAVGTFSSSDMETFKTILAKKAVDIRFVSMQVIAELVPSSCNRSDRKNYRISTGCLLTGTMQLLHSSLP